MNELDLTSETVTSLEQLATLLDQARQKNSHIKKIRLTKEQLRNLRNERKYFQFTSPNIQNMRLLTIFGYEIVIAERYEKV